MAQKYFIKGTFIFLSCFGTKGFILPGGLGCLYQWGLPWKNTIGCGLNNRLLFLTVKVRLLRWGTCLVGFWGDLSSRLADSHLLLPLYGCVLTWLRETEVKSCPCLRHASLITSSKPKYFPEAPPKCHHLEVRLQHEFGGKHEYAVLERGDSASLRMGLAEYPEVGLGKGRCGGKIEGEKEEGGRREEGVGGKKLTFPGTSSVQALC